MTTKTNQNAGCSCPKTSCGCGGTSGNRCSCGERCDCKAECKCGPGCQCAAAK